MGLQHTTGSNEITAVMQLAEMNSALTTAVKIKKPKKKKAVDVDSLIAALDGDGSQAEAAASAEGEPAATEGSDIEDFGVKKKRTKKKSSKMDFSSAFEELGVQDGADAAEAASAESAPAEGAVQSAEGELLHQPMLLRPLCRRLDCNTCIVLDRRTRC